MSDLLRCKFCDWTIAKWYTTKGGAPRKGMLALELHAMQAHKKEFLEITGRSQGLPTDVENGFLDRELFREIDPEEEL